VALDLRQAARDNLWLRFTRMGGAEPPIIVRGEGCDLDTLAGLFAVQVGSSYPRRWGRPRSSRCVS
jgi:hypothetical protein